MTSKTAQAAYRQALHSGLAMLRAFRAQSEYLTVQQIQVAYEIAMKPGISMQELTKNTGLASSSVTRNVAALGDWHSLGKPGMGLVETAEDPLERRAKVCFLTIKGRSFIAGLLGLTVKEEETWEYPTSREWLTRLHRAR